MRKKHISDSIIFSTVNISSRYFVKIDGFFALFIDKTTLEPCLSAKKVRIVWNHKDFWRILKEKSENCETQQKSQKKSCKSQFLGFRVAKWTKMDITFNYYAGNEWNTDQLSIIVQIWSVSGEKKEKKKIRSD